jgi:hypothetical protein
VSVANVTLVDEGTSLSRSTLSGAGGEYTFTALNPATYTLKVERPGFKVLEKKGIVVGTQEFLSVDMQLTVGDVTQSVNVEASDVPLLETENASTGQTIDTQKLQDLPNMGRNPFYEGVKISQNVTPGGNPQFNRMEDQSGSSQISIAGGPVRGNNYLLDGISITDSTNRAVIIPTVESVQELKLQANTYDAEVGRTGGGTFNLFLKSGTNDYHAAGMGYTWVQPWLANTYFGNAAGRKADGTLNSPVADQPFYNYGGAVGGPLSIPKIYNGKNRTFFWVTAEAYRQKKASSTKLALPTALERAGDFSQSFTSAGALQTIYDPLSGTTRQPFAGNVIPKSRINPTGLAVASYYPLPNVSGTPFGGSNFNTTAIEYDRADQVTAKLDQQVTSWWRGSISYLHYGSREPGYPYFGLANPATSGQGMLVRHVDATQANSTITPSSTMVVSLRFGFNRFPNKTYQFASDNFDLVGKLGFPQSLVDVLPYKSFPSFSMTGDVTSLGAGSFSQSNFYSRSFSASVSKYLGRHSVKAGFDFRVIHDSGINSVSPGAYSFSQSFSSKSGTSTVAGTGASVASLLLGYPASGSVSTSLPIEDHVNYYGVFIHDDFKLTPKLTLNYGLRYEYETGLTSELNSLIVGFDTSAVNPIQKEVSGITTNGVIQYSGQNGAGVYATSPTVAKFAPRAGFAWNVAKKTTIRGGYGLFWAPFTFSLVNPLGYSYSTPYVASNDGNVTPANSLSNPFPNGIQTPVGNGAGASAGLGGQSFNFFDHNAKSTRIHQYSFDLQREMGGFVFAGGFTGSVSHNVIQGTPSININQLPSQYLSLGNSLNDKVPNPFFGTSAGILNTASATITRAQTLLPYPQFGTISLDSSDQNHALYYAVYVKMQKRMGKSLNFLTTFTWSRNMDASNGGAGNTFSGQPGSGQDNYNREAEYARSTIDTPARWTTAINYQLPFGANQKFLNHNKFLDIAVGGWSFNIQTTMQTGFPLAISQTNQNSIIGASVQRPNATGVSPETSGSLEDRLSNYINKAAFSQAPQFTFGNLSRTITMRGPGIANTDLSIFKSYQLERFKAQFRMEVFNLTNTPQFYGPQTSINSSTFGQITSQANFSRIFQAGVRFEF